MNSKAPPKTTTRRAARSNAKSAAKEPASAGRRTAKTAAKTNGAKANGAAGTKAAAPEKDAPKAAPAASGRKAEFILPDPAEFSANLFKVATQSQQIIADFFANQAGQTGSAPVDPLNIADSFMELLRNMVANPQKLFEAQVDLWQAHFNLWQTTAQRMMGHDVDPVILPAKGDKRWRHEDWQSNEIFDFIKQSYLLTARWMQDTVSEVEGVDPKTRQKVDFYTKQFADALSPTNFLFTNPEVMRETLSSNGENLVKGLNNLLEDLERGKGQLAIKQTDLEHFKVGMNVATAPGKVIYQNEIAQLLQFNPTTDEVYERPLVIFPPWINKYYILDLRPENSFIRWAVSKGYTVFVCSWVNPDEELSHKTFEDYMREGILELVHAACEATGSKDVSAIGYCIGGTLLGATLAYMAATHDTRIAAATFFAAQLDFSEAGELQVFIDDEQLDYLEERMSKHGGTLDAHAMATTFNMLRANDLIWSYVVNNYMLGKEPMRFDLLYWNSDMTRMPKTLHLYYLRECYHKNTLSTGNMTLGGITLDLKDVKIPVYMQSSREDHIAPYGSIYRGAKALGGPVRFIIAGSGHIAGVINHPDAKKYQHWTNPQLPETVEEWWDAADEHPGSWWPDWDAWLSKKSGKKVPARIPGDGKLPVIEDAPGSYVAVKSGY